MIPELIPVTYNTKIDLLVAWLVSKSKFITDSPTSESYFISPKTVILVRDFQRVEQVAKILSSKDFRTMAAPEWGFTAYWELNISQLFRRCDIVIYPTNVQLNNFHLINNIVTLDLAPMFTTVNVSINTVILVNVESDADQKYFMQSMNTYYRQKKKFPPVCMRTWFQIVAIAKINEEGK